METGNPTTQPESPKRLTPSKWARRGELERIIEGTLESFLKCGAALCEINEDMLFEGFETFEEYCRAKWNISARRGRNSINPKAVRARGKHRSKHSVPTAQKAPSNSELINQAERRVDGAIQLVESRSAITKDLKTYG